MHAAYPDMREKGKEGQTLNCVPLKCLTTIQSVTAKGERDVVL